MDLITHDGKLSIPNFEVLVARKHVKMHLCALWKGLFFNDHDDIRYGIKYVSGRIHFPIIDLEKYGSNRP